MSAHGMRAGAGGDTAGDQEDGDGSSSHLSRAEDEAILAEEGALYGFSRDTCAFSRDRQRRSEGGCKGSTA